MRALRHDDIKGALIGLNNVRPVKGLSPGAKIFAVIHAFMILLLLVIIFLSSSTYVSSPVYRRDPLIGNYSFIASSGAAPVTTDKATYVVAYVDLNLAEVRPGDGFSLYVPMNKGSCVYKSFYGNPVVYVTVASTTLFYNGSAWLLNFTARPPSRP